MNLGMKSELMRGAIVQFRMDWYSEPTPINISIVTRVAKDKGWANVTSPFGSKRIPNPVDILKIITKPIVVRLKQV